MPLVARALLLLCLLGHAFAATAPAPFEIDFLYGRDELYPSALISLTGNSSFTPRDPSQLGDPAGVIAARVVTATKGVTVRVTLAATPFFAESAVAVTLDEPGTYRIAPTIRFHNEKLAAVRQPVANLVVKVTVRVDDGPPRDQYRRVIVHSIHDGITDLRLRGAELAAAADGAWSARTAFLLAAYVNENHPAVDQTITKAALTEDAGMPPDQPKRLVKRFEGYLPQQAVPLTGVLAHLSFVTSSVRTEIHAIYDSLQRMGFKYADLGAPTGSAVSHGVQAASVRLLGEVVESRQANDLETALVMASVLRKLSIDPVLYLLPGRRVLLGAYLTGGRNPAHRLVLDPQQLGAKKSFDEAVKLGEQAYAPYAAALDAQVKAPADVAAKGGSGGCLVLDVQEARVNGILPIAEPR